MISAPTSANWPSMPSRSVKTLPPTRPRASSTTTSWPAAWTSVAATRPESPAPTTSSVMDPSHDAAAVEDDHDPCRVRPGADVEPGPRDVHRLRDPLQRHLALQHPLLDLGVDREPHLGRHRPGRDGIAADGRRQLPGQGLRQPDDAGLG